VTHKSKISSEVAVSEWNCVARDILSTWNEPAFGIARHFHFPCIHLCCFPNLQFGDHIALQEISLVTKHIMQAKYSLTHVNSHFCCGLKTRSFFVDASRGVCLGLAAFWIAEVLAGW